MPLPSQCLPGAQVWGPGFLRSCSAGAARLRKRRGGGRAAAGRVDGEIWRRRRLRPITVRSGRAADCRRAPHRTRVGNAGTGFVRRAGNHRTIDAAKPTHHIRSWVTRTSSIAARRTGCPTLPLSACPSDWGLTGDSTRDQPWLRRRGGSVPRSLESWLPATTSSTRSSFWTTLHRPYWSGIPIAATCLGGRPADR